ncbi:DMT family transporter [Listeria seeligeri]|uniref:DMT family transporter n=1 Tax=Listeria seeligeri TaxID=1640 RepID=UPI0016297C94|nr:DMT family transporter [Listeria seeligeri]MBC1527664.1 DMT family transporter [Listeria seeligeri]MBC1832720.1 DMT family transporter [Listeria seeligeri]MBC1868704.1 DMT family transporter [Listeria seeligeri]MBC1877343.1 DMT family transporter [Listeria seeligeri]MBC1942799.1 DMT family transporter [Listeria seeligeri]
MIILFIVSGLLAGMVLPVQTAINTRLSTYTKSPFLASWVSFMVGTTVLLIVCLFTQKSWPISSEMIASNPWYIWVGGGTLGVIFLTANILLLPRLGSALLVMITVCGQMIMAIIIDNFGLFQVPMHEINLERLLGVILMFGGIYLMQRF